MTARTPPIPPENVSGKGPGDDPKLNREQRKGVRPGVPDPDKQGQQANTKVNLTPHLSTQDR